jgi:hypothetical protein
MNIKAEVIRFKDAKEGDCLVPINALIKKIRLAQNKKHPELEVKIDIKSGKKTLQLSNKVPINGNPELLVLRIYEP